MKLLTELLRESTVNPSVQPDKKEPKSREVDSLPDDFPTKTDAKIKTGLKSVEGATTLYISYFKNKTYVTPVGERFNADPWYYSGLYNAEDVKRWYVKLIKEME